MKKKQLFSLRKLTVGIASVSLGTVVFLSGAQAADAQGNAQDATTITQNAYNVVNNLPNISDQTKDAYIAKITAAAGNDKLTDIEGIVKTAKAEDAQVGTAKKVAKEQDAKAVNSQVELAKKAAAEQVTKAQAEVNKLANISKENKAQYNDKIAKAATADIPAIFKDAKAVDAQVATAKNVAKEQAAAKDKAVKALNQKTADAYQVINSLKNITDKQQLSFLHQVEVDSGTNNGERIDAIVADAKQLDAQFAYDKEQKAKAEQKAARELNTLTQVAYNTVNGLHNLTDQQKDAFNKQILHDSGNNNGHNINNIVANAKSLDEQNGNAKHAREAGASTVAQKDKAVRELNTLTQVAYNTVNNLPNLTDAQKDDFNHQILVDSGNNNGQKINDIVAKAKTLDKQTADAKDKAVRELNQKTADAYQVINSLKNITNKQQLSFLHQVEVDSGTNNGNYIDAIVADAKQLDAQFAYDKEQKAKAVKALNQKTADAYYVVNNLPNLTDAQKDDFNHQILVDSGNNEGQKINDIVAAAKQKDAKSAQAKHVREEGANTNLPADVAKKVKDAHNTIDALKNLKPQQKVAAHRKLNEVARTNAKAIDTVVAQAKELNTKQAPAKNEGAKQQIELAQKAHAQQIKQAQAVVNKLENLSKDAKDQYNKRIAQAATDEVEALVKHAQAQDEYAANAKKQITTAQKAHVQAQAEYGENAKKQITTAQKAHAQQITQAQALVNKLENLSKDAKAQYNQKIAQAATDEVEALVKDAQAQDKYAANAKKQITTAQKAHAQQIAQAQAVVNKLENLSKDAKAQYNQKIAQAATDEVEAIVKKAQAENAKQVPAKKVVKDSVQNNKEQKATNNSKAGNNNAKAVTGQKESKATTAPNKANAQQKAKDAKKQLPATGEQDQVLFGLLSGSLFASAGTLFLLNARRRKENE
ncbi:YSIRK-type signal peptide-containing protein [Staphylococcus simulans]|uniref:YSIRK-type signal peptide-containing protein n=1 Tax=Staphylococcus simulans TaxID=1286 RepID=UPI00399B1522